jgi:hypothetical protein
VVRVLPHSSLGIRGIIQSRNFPKLNRRLQYLGRANTSRRRAVVQNTRFDTNVHQPFVIRPRPIGQNYSTAVRGSTDWHGPRILWSGRIEPPSIQYHSATQNNTPKSKLLYFTYTTNVVIQSEQQPHRRESGVSYLPRNAKNSNVSNITLREVGFKLRRD